MVGGEPGRSIAGNGRDRQSAAPSRAEFQKETGTTFPFVAYRGAAPAMQDLLGAIST
jgi:tripartite-type tricarboxylate transporter receptor subunit TctC